MGIQLQFNVHSLKSEKSPGETVSVLVNQLIIAGWAGRDPDALEAHIRELEAIGIARPKSVPTYYALSPTLLSQNSEIYCLGTRSSGEVEVVIVSTGAGLLLTVGSDHTDRYLETFEIAASKQVCAKPIARDAWLLADVMQCWDQLHFRSVVSNNGSSHSYQDGLTALNRSPDELIALYAASTANNQQDLPHGTVMYCGTIPVIGEISHSEKLTLELTDPVNKRTITHAYKTIVLEVNEE